MLRWENFPHPFACGPPFARLDELEVAIGPTAGSFDLAISIAGGGNRQMVVRLRPNEVTTAPFAFLEDGKEVPLRSFTAGSAPQRLGQGPFLITLAFEELGDATRAQLRIARRPGGRDLYQAACEVAGKGWTAGAILIETPSPVRPFAVSLESVVAEGKLAPGGPRE
jgi:hypothetical protein